MKKPSSTGRTSPVTLLHRAKGRAGANPSPSGLAFRAFPTDPRRAKARPSIHALLDLAGLRDGFDVAELATAAARGVPFDVVEGLKAWMPPGVVSRSIASASTLSRRQRAGEPLIGAEADRALRMVAILAKAVNVFGDDEKARRWLSKPKAVLDPTGAARSPYELLDSEHGARLVEQRLVQIDHGMYA